METAVASWGFHCILKGSSGSGGQSVRKIENPHDLAAARAPLKNHGPWLVQERVEGATGGVQFVAHKGRLLGWFALYKRVKLGHGRGPTLVGEICAPPGLEEICSRACAAGGLSGLHGFDFIHAPDGRVLLIDPHLGRCTTLNHFGTLCGVNLAARWREALLGQDLETIQRPVKAGAVFLKFPEILEYICERGPLNAWRDVRPWRRDLHIGWGSRHEFRALAFASIQLLWGRARIFAGALRRRFFR